MLEIPGELKWELLVIDNNSIDATRLICAQFLALLPIRYVFEPQQGLSRARNRGVREANADLYAFTDDDIDLDTKWLSELWSATQALPDVLFFGGKILPKWDVPPPRWLAEHSAGMLKGLCGCCDRGSVPRFLNEDDPPFLGANMAYRKNVFSNGRNFREDLGLSGEIKLLGEETELINELRRNGFKGFYVPAALVHHHIPRVRMTERYVRKWFKGAGATEVRLGKYEDTERKWFGAPGYLWRQLFLHVRIYAVTRYTCPSFVWLPAETTMAKTWGAICEFRQRCRRVVRSSLKLI